MILSAFVDSFRPTNDEMAVEDVVFIGTSENERWRILG